MKILYVFRSIAVWGGIERILTDKMNWLVAHGYEVTLLTTDQGEHAVPYEQDSRIRHHDLGICFHHQYRYGGLRRLWDVWQRRRRFRQQLAVQLQVEHPDVIVCTTADDVGMLAKLKGHTPLVVESHTICSRLVDTGRLRRLRRWWQLRQLRRADVLVALTEGDAADWRQHLSRVEVIPNMVHTPHFGRGACDMRSPSSLHMPRALFVGRIDAQKQPDHLLDAWQRVQALHPDWTLDVYGEGPQGAWLRQEVVRRSLRINLHAPTSDIFSRYAEASMLLLTSSFEPFGLVIPEAMACGLPVVAYDSPFGPRAIITDGLDGFLVPPQDVDTFARRVCQLIADEPLRRRMGQQALLTARRYEASTVMPLWERLFRQLPDCC